MNYIVELMLRQLNVPYLWGGKNPLVGLDCSGLATLALKAAKIAPATEHNAQGLFDYLLPRSLRWKPPVDLFDQLIIPDSFAFYGKDESNIRHVAYCLPGGFIIEAHGDETVKSLEDARHYDDGHGAYVRLSTLNHRPDLAVCLKPNYGG